MEMSASKEGKVIPSTTCDSSSLIYSFVSDVVRLYYKDNDAVEEDNEIQAFVKDVHNFGMQDIESCGESRANSC